MPSVAGVPPLVLSADHSFERSIREFLAGHLGQHDMQLVGLVLMDHDLDASGDRDALSGSNCRRVRQQPRLEGVISPGLGDDTLGMLFQGCSVSYVCLTFRVVLCFHAFNDKERTNNT